VWLGHDSSVSIAAWSVDAKQVAICTVASIQTNKLPFLSALWLTEQRFVVAGHDCYPILYKHNETDNEIAYVANLDKTKVSEDEDETMSAMERFRSLDKRKTNSNSPAPVFQHLNSITQLAPFQTTDTGKITEFSSSGRDGKITTWRLTVSNEEE